MGPTSAYLHVPFCLHRCGYCNFAVVAGRDDLQEPYVRAVETELSRLGDPRPVQTLYFGGGTPTRLRESPLDELLRIARRWFPPAAGDGYAEWTVEANPGDLGPETIHRLVACGVTRLSLGMQSLSAEKLRGLERDHTPDDVARVIDAAHGAGLQVSVDLIFAAPNETIEAWRSDLRAAIALAPDHVSVYGLTYEHGTAFWSRRRKGSLTEVDEETQREMYLAAIDDLHAAGFEHYEISNHAKPGSRSRHNEAYWAGREYFAVGPGAARYVNGVRETNHRSTTTWMRRLAAGDSPVAERERLTPEQRARERLVFGLRRMQGVDCFEFEQETSFSIESLAGPTIAELIGSGLLLTDDERIWLSRHGLLVSDAIWPELL